MLGHLRETGQYDEEISPEVAMLDRGGRFAVERRVVQEICDRWDYQCSPEEARFVEVAGKLDLAT